MGWKKTVSLFFLLALVGVASVFAIIVTSPDYSISTSSANTVLVLRNNERGSTRLSVQLAVYTDAQNACFYPTLTTGGFGTTATWKAPAGQKIVSWDESAVRCEAPGN